MTPELQAFLTAEDLDDVLTARGNITIVGNEDEAVIRAILAEWVNGQAISNLLFHPTLIPDDIRLSTLRRGLTERKVVYYVLAAIVGFQSIDPAALSTADRERVAADLWSLIAQDDGILAQRASVSIRGFASEGDAPVVFALLSHSDKTVRHNLRSWLFATFKDRGVEPFAAAAGESGLAEDLRRQVVAEFTDFLANPPQGFKSPLFPLYGYIPNLRDSR